MQQSRNTVKKNWIIRKPSCSTTQAQIPKIIGFFSSDDAVVGNLSQTPLWLDSVVRCSTQSLKSSRRPIHRWQSLHTFHRLFNCSEMCVIWPRLRRCRNRKWWWTHTFRMCSRVCVCVCLCVLCNCGHTKSCLWSHTCEALNICTSCQAEGSLDRECMCVRYALYVCVDESRKRQWHQPSIQAHQVRAVILQ